MLYQPPTTRPSPGVRIALGFAIAIVCYQLYALAFQIYRDSQIDIQYQTLLAENKRLANERDELTQLIAYLQTPGYREKEQKKIANLVKPGERTIIIERPAGAVISEDGDAYVVPESVRPGPKRWWVFLFGDDDLLTRPLDALQESSR